MTKTIKISKLPEFDMAELLQSDEDIANYLTRCAASPAVQGGEG